MKISKMDGRIISFMRMIEAPLSRFAIFLIYFWFGLLKVLSLSPASPLVLSLLHRTMPFMAPDTFLICFGIFEMVIGLVFLIPHLERLAIALLLIHLITTILPLILLSGMVWQSTFVPTLEGQYIIKNILIIALAIGIGARLRPGKM